MAQIPDLGGRWISPPENHPVNISMTGDGNFNMKALSPEDQLHWKAGYGQVFESRKLHATFNGHAGDVTLQGWVSADLRTINWSNQRIWHRQ